ncbi:MAG TPA: phosphoglycerate dehydrogenase [Gemmatales bacterium]|nr:phosphoglycerate dehydrogenase [Gemmatales bacterium]HMP58516.1 phosphoglycerate dehydrogenase [Gemmatales bacterium]
MPRVFISDPLEVEGLDMLRAAGLDLDVRPGLKGEELAEAIRGSEGLIVRSGTRVTAGLLEQPGRLRAIVRAGVGVDNIDVAAATRKGIVVMNTPGGNTLSTAEQTVALLYALARHTPAADASLHAGKWERGKFVGVQLAGKTLGIIGLGRIGREVAKRALAMDMKVLGFDPMLAADRIAALGVEPAGDVGQVLEASDFVTLHVPLTEQTRHFLGAAELARMKRGARLINCARGGLVDETALVAALQSGHLAGAGIDVFEQEPPPPDHPLLHQPNVVCTPHLGASTTEAQRGVALEAAQLLIDFLTRGQVQSAVNMAAVDRRELLDLRATLDMTYRLGLLISQLASASLRHVRLSYRGEVASRSTPLLTSAFLVGLLEPWLSEPVNLVNADLLARERGIELETFTSAARSDFNSLVRAEVRSDQGMHAVAATLFGSEYLRLVHFGDFRLDAYLDGIMLLFSHRDRPGLIGFIGTVFGRHEVNIAQMAVGRAMPGGLAIAVLNLDSLPSEAALAEVRDHPDIESVHLIKLPPKGQLPPWLQV